MAGWVRVYRSILFDDQWTKEPFTKGQAWIDMILLANWEPGSITVQGVVVPVDRGDLSWSEGKLASRWQWSVGKVRRFFDELERYGRIDRKRYKQRDRRKSILTICDYDKFNGENQQDGIGDGIGNGIGDGIVNKKKRNRETTNAQSAGESAEFAEFWKTYPKKKSKTEAKKAWKQVKGDSIFNEIMTGLQRAISSPDWAKQDGQFIPYPSSWLRAGGWMDEENEVAAPGKTCDGCRHKLNGGCPSPGQPCDSWAERI